MSIKVQKSLLNILRNECYYVRLLELKTRDKTEKSRVTR
jgi:hypothetical protein